MTTIGSNARYAMAAVLAMAIFLGACAGAPRMNRTEPPAAAETEKPGPDYGELRGLLDPE